MEWRRGLRRSCRARRFSQATRASRLPGPISSADETGARRSGRASSDCCRPPSGSFQSFNDHSVGNLSPRSGAARCHVAKAMSASRCLHASPKLALRPQPILFRRASLGAAGLPVRISQTSNLLRLDFDVTASHGSTPGRGGRFGDYSLRWNHEALPSKHVFPMVLTCAIRPFLRVEIRFGCRQ